jgi:hypothetical protein
MALDGDLSNYSVSAGSSLDNLRTVVLLIDLEGYGSASCSSATPRSYTCPGSNRNSARSIANNV